MRLVLYTGKGGVGKTTTAAATAVCAAQRGARTLVVSADGAHSLGDVLARRLGDRPVEVAAGLDAAEIDPRAEMLRNWGRVSAYLVELFEHQGIESVVAEELALLPGADELMTLLAVEELAEKSSYDFVVIDCAPTGSTLRLLTLPDVLTTGMRLLPKLLRLASSVLSPVARRLVAVPIPGSAVFRDVEVLVGERAARLHERLLGRDTSARLVVTPERMAIDEARRAFTQLSLFGVPCDAVVMNRVLPPEAAAEPFFREWGRLQRERRVEGEEHFAPMPVLEAALQDDEVAGLASLAEHGHSLFSQHEPAGKLCPPLELRIESRAAQHSVRVPLPGARADQLEVTRVGAALLVRAGSLRRAIPLPERFASLELASARLEGGELVVELRRPAARAGGEA